MSLKLILILAVLNRLLLLLLLWLLLELRRSRCGLPHHSVFRYRPKGTTIPRCSTIESVRRTLVLCRRALLGRVRVLAEARQ